jgi:Asp-tRNA(Asn)/Glu-tRNA(Gln) amidotransferase A subunit family amidase
MRPTFGRVSRYGVMAAGFSLDRNGPMFYREGEMLLLAKAYQEKTRFYVRNPPLLV